ncbi:MAG: hypothetical protein A2020_03805 [Lentisphaerae bacterium GWF2_45_14]|nr:MAG: hypothetical protein A2020_03805 [Lentisphaerae bacterium GWF2_45_14]
MLEAGQAAKRPLIRKAEEKDVREITRLLNSYAAEQLLLPRTEEDVMKYLGNFIIAETESETFMGCAALRNFGDNLYEVRSLAVKKDFSGKGLGSELVEFLISKLTDSGRPVRVFALTYRAAIFKRLGFHTVSKDLFPQKIWSDCSVCPKMDCCDEEAVMLEI